MGLGNITEEDRQQAQVLAVKRQKRLRGKTRLQIDRNTWIYVPKKITRSKRRLKAYLQQREERIRAKKRQDREEKIARQQRSKEAAKANKEKREAEKLYNYCEQ